MARSNRNWAKMVGYDQSDGTKTKARKLQYDPERNIFTRDPDKLNPQRWLRAPGPDSQGRGQVFPPNHSIGEEFAVGHDTAPGTSAFVAMLSISSGGLGVTVVPGISSGGLDFSIAENSMYLIEIMRVV